jgi:hypothetical protein
MIIVSSESDETIVLACFFRNTRFNGMIRSSSVSSIDEVLLSNFEDVRLDIEKLVKSCFLFDLFLGVDSLHISEYFLKQK